MGKQSSMMLLDTGGSIRWIPSSRSTTSEFANRNKYTQQIKTSVSINQEFKASCSGGKYIGNVKMSALGGVFPKFTFVEVVETIEEDYREGYDRIIGMRIPLENDESCLFVHKPHLCTLISVNKARAEILGLYTEIWNLEGPGRITTIRQL
ncbi:hypothetical protein CSKR_104942 [Clonorchis sinensis]|uniref:Peptidase A1 domain-containing protein n=1 Tax=Clonorchis sinensis TaxID=79923 RepID=A0A419Q6R0_CLOSI|nr:hypothetical protein CSKR_104942 [Clonorchis sinensis]